MQSEIYRAYIQSREWRKVSNAAKERAGFKCQLCGSTGRRLETHHNTYERLGYERQTDLVVVCYECHTLHHCAKRYPTLFKWLLFLLKHLPRKN